MSTPARTGPAKTGKIRWLIIGLTFAIATVAFLDRSNISIAAPLLKAELGLSDYELGFVFSAFLIGYALTQPFSGRLADRLGAYRVIGVGIVLWCILTAATAMVPAAWPGAFALLIGVRLLLGAGESMIFPASNRLVANWIPSQERGLANGIIFAGVGAGAGIAPPLISTIMLAYGWRAAFWASALLGVVALLAWRWLARETPRAHPWVKNTERAHIEAGLTDAPTPGAKTQLSWGRILTNRNVLLLLLSYFCFGYVAYIFFTWFFTYLSTVRGMNLRSSGIYGMLPFIAMAIASPLGGWISDRLATRFGPWVGRCLFGAACMTGAALFVALATGVADVRLACVVLAGGSGALYLAQSTFWTLSADMGGRTAGSVSGLINMGAQIGGAVVAAVTPVLAAHLGWAGSFLFASGVCLIGALAWLPVDPRVRLASSTDR